MAIDSGAERSIAARQRRRRARVAIFVAALVCLMVFGYAWANVTMRLQRHITARDQWATDQGKLGMTYASLASGAAGNDALAYGLLLQIAQNDAHALQQDSSAMSPKGVDQRTEFLKQVQGCLPNTINAFNAQPPQATANCRQLLVSK